MLIKTEEDIVKVVKQDKWMMTILTAAKSLDLPDWWVCAGFVRAKVWDTLHGFSNRTHLPDVDVIYFNKSDLSENTEKNWSLSLNPFCLKCPGQLKMRQECISLMTFPIYFISECNLKIS